jgi:integrase
LPANHEAVRIDGWLDYVIVQDGRDVGRLNEDRHTRPEYRWFWSITVTSIRSSARPHSCGYKLANDGQDTRAIQHYLGHRSIASTVRYTALAPDRFKHFWKD